jgi:hypothetical protein
LIAALKRAYQATESKLEETTTPENYQAVNDRMMSQSDPDAALVRQGGGDSRPRYKHHRVIDDQKGVITATETTPGSIAENKNCWSCSISTRAIRVARRKSSLLMPSMGRLRITWPVSSAG